METVGGIEYPSQVLQIVGRSDTLIVTVYTRPYGFVARSMPTLGRTTRIGGILRGG
jgi:hypothetical protein